MGAFFFYVHIYTFHFANSSNKRVDNKEPAAGTRLQIRLSQLPVTTPVKGISVHQATGECARASPGAHSGPGQQLCLKIPSDPEKISTRTLKGKSLIRRRFPTVSLTLLYSEFLPLFFLLYPERWAALPSS